MTECMLEGAELDAAVARASGWTIFQDMCGPAQWATRAPGESPGSWPIPITDVKGEPFPGAGDGLLVRNYKPSTDWAYGGPIIERERIQMSSYVNGEWAAICLAGRVQDFDKNTCRGATPLIAAMRAFVASRT